MRAFVRDVNSHKDQVEKFLQKLSLDDILDKKKELAERDCRNMADEILKDFGYVFFEHPVDKT